MRKLITETVAPLITLPFSGGMIVLQTYLLLRAHGSFPPTIHEMILLGAYIGLWCIFIYLCLDAQQNAGAITRIEVRDGFFTWTKQNLWGSSIRKWKAETITSITLFRLGRSTMLRVHRKYGFRLGAFSHHTPESLEWVADALRAAVAAQTIKGEQRPD
jgi:hypothetical protein